MSEDSGERTEQATEQRLKEARKKGKLSRSQDFTAWVGIGAAGVVMAGAISTAAEKCQEMFVGIAGVIRNPTVDNAMVMFERAMGTIPAILGPFLAAVAAVTMLTALVQGGIRLRGVTTKWEQFNILAGAKRIFGMQALWEGVKALLKTAAVGAALYFVIQNIVPVLTSTGGHPISYLMEVAASGAGTLLAAAVAVGLLLAAADVMVVAKRNRKHTRMTKKEAKDEHKKSEGDPMIKGQRRARQIAMSRNRMMSEVADSNVVLINPTEIAIALKYEPGKSAPRVVAKGRGLVAARIRERATEAGVPLVKDVPLARTLHKTCELGQEIPAELYAAVARILVFVDGLKRRGQARGTHTMPKRKNT